MDLNGIFLVDEDLVEAPKSIDSTVIKLMCCFKGNKQVYYYLDNVGGYVYEDMIEILEGLQIKKKMKMKKTATTSEHIGSSSSALTRSSDRLLSIDAKPYLNGFVSKILANSQVRETCLPAHINMNAN